MWSQKITYSERKINLYWKVSISFVSSKSLCLTRETLRLHWVLRCTYQMSLSLVFENVNRKWPICFNLKNWPDKFCFISRFHSSMDKNSVVNGAEHCSSTEREHEESLQLNWFVYAFRVLLPCFLEQLHFSAELNTLHNVIRIVFHLGSYNFVAMKYHKFTLGKSFV